MIALLILAAASAHSHSQELDRRAGCHVDEVCDPCAGWEWCPGYAEAFGIKNRWNGPSGWAIRKAKECSRPGYTVDPLYVESHQSCPRPLETK